MPKSKAKNYMILLRKGFDYFVWLDTNKDLKTDHSAMSALRESKATL